MQLWCSCWPCCESHNSQTMLFPDQRWNRWFLRCSNHRRLNGCWLYLYKRYPDCPADGSSEPGYDRLQDAGRLLVPVWLHCSRWWCFSGWCNCPVPSGYKCGMCPSVYPLQLLLNRVHLQASWCWHDRPMWWWCYHGLHHRWWCWWAMKGGWLSPYIRLSLRRLPCCNPWKRDILRWLRLWCGIRRYHHGKLQSCRGCHTCWLLPEATGSTSLKMIRITFSYCF